MNWKHKALIQKLLGSVPGGRTLHYMLQRKMGGLKHMESECATKIDDWHIMMGHLQSAGIEVAGARIMEIGSGWYPTFPVCLHLLGAETVHTYDLRRQMRAELTEKCLLVIGRHLDTLRQHAKDPGSIDQRLEACLRRFRGNPDIETATEGAVVYHAPADATRSGLEDRSIDLVFSNSVLEHVPRAVIEGMMTESMRILARDGNIFHSVNSGDHYAYVDNSISQMNYLQFSGREWKKWDNAFLYQNRIRAREFPAMAEDAGFDVVVNTARPTEQRLRELDALPAIADEFKEIPPEELCITSIDFVARKAGCAPRQHQG